MTRFALSLLIVMATANAAVAEWQMYRKDNKVIASFNYRSFAQFRNQPSVWVRWHYVSPKNGLGGKKIQFTADCPKHRLYEISAVPYDHDGNFLAENRHYDAPQEYPLKNDPLNKATFKILCR